MAEKINLSEVAAISKLGALIVPMPGTLAVKVEAKAERMPSGLYIPEDTARTIHEERPTQGIVVAIGDKEAYEDGKSELGLDVGDRVVFGKYSGTKLSWLSDPADRNSKEIVIILSERDILCKINSDEQVNLKVKA